MLRWRWLAIVLLFTGCGISPYHAKPPCPDPGAQQTSECYYMLRMVKNTTPGWASGTTDSSAVEANKDYADTIDFSTLTRRVMPLQNYPYFVFNFPVENAPGEFPEGSVAYFVSKPNSSTLIYLTPEQLCNTKKDLIVKHAKGEYEPNRKVTYDPYPIPEKEIKSCPDLEHVWDSMPK